MKEFIKAMDELPLIVKIIFCIPAIDIIWGIYRIIKAVDTKNNLWIVIGILTIIPGAFFVWILDLIWVIMHNKPFYID